MGSNACDPAPALGRGLRLLRLLDRHPWRLEELVQATGMPRSSLARILASLELNGCARREGMRWQAACRLVAPTSSSEVSAWEAAPAMLAGADLRGELWAFQAAGPVLVGVAEPAGWAIPGLIAPGFQADIEEMMAPVLLWWAVRGALPERPWQRAGDRLLRLPRAEAARLVAGARVQARASCPAVNHRRIRRHAVLLPHEAGVLAAACPQGRQAPGLIGLLRRAIAQCHSLPGKSTMRL